MYLISELLIVICIVLVIVRNYIELEEVFQKRLP